MRTIPLYIMLVCACLIPAHLTAAPIVLTFDSLPDDTAVRTEYSSLGVTFLRATAITAGISLNEFDFPPYSGQNVVFDEAGPIEVTFSTPQTYAGGYFTYLTPLTLTAFDAGGNVVGSISSLFTSNTVGFGAAGSLPNELLSINGPAFVRVVIRGGDAGESFVLDNFAFESVPEPGTFGLIAAGLMAAMYRGRGRFKRVPALPRLK